MTPEPTDLPGGPSEVAGNPEETMFMPQAVALVSGEDLVITCANARFATAFALPQDQVIGRAIEALAKPMGYAGLVAAMARDRRVLTMTNMRLADGNLHCLVVAPLQRVDGGLVWLVMLADGGPEPDWNAPDVRVAQHLLRASDRQIRGCRRLPLHLVVVDTKSAVLCYNVGAQRLLQAGSSPALPTFWHTSGGIFRREEHPVHCVLQGRSVMGQEACIRAGETIFHVAVGALPLLDAEGKPEAVLLALHDLTEVRLAQRRLTRAVEAERRHTAEMRAIYAVSQALARTLDLRECLDVVAASLAEAGAADRCAVMLLAGDRLSFAASYGLDAEAVKALEQRSCDLEKAAANHIQTAISTGKPVVIQDADSDPALARMAVGQGMRSLLIVPLVNAGKVLGVAYLDRTGRRRMFFGSQIRLTTAIATQAAVAIARAQLYRSEHERSQNLETMISELNHRVKNNLAIVAGLLSLQLVDPRLNRESRALLRNTVTRIQSIAVIHQLLYEDDVRMVEMRETIQRIALVVGQALCPTGEVELSVTGDTLMLPSKLATSLGVVVNELLCNSIRHGLEGVPGGKVCASLQVGDEIILEVTDNGRGLPVGFGESHVRTGGMIVRGLVEHELHGTYALANRPEGGAVATVRFRRERVEQAIAEQAVVGLVSPHSYAPG